MAAPTVRTVDTVPPPATRADAPADYVPKQDKFMAALPPLAVQINGVAADMNALGVYLDQLKTDVNGYKNTASTAADSASGSASAAATSASQAQTYASAAQAAAGAPAIAGKADQVLSVNANATGVEYRVAPKRPSASNAGKAVRYNSAGTDFETAYSLPDLAAGSAGKALKVNAAGNGYEIGDASPIVKLFTSTNQSIVPDSFNAIPHGLATFPKVVSAYLVCTAAWNDYVVGDRLELSPSMYFAPLPNGSSPTLRGIQVTSDATNLYLKQGQSPYIPYKNTTATSGGYAAAPSANFAIVLRAM